MWLVLLNNGRGLKFRPGEIGGVDGHHRLTVSFIYSPNGFIDATRLINDVFHLLGFTGFGECKVGA
jgi:hypothetical protein